MHNTRSSKALVKAPITRGTILSTKGKVLKPRLTTKQNKRNAVEDTIL